MGAHVNSVRALVIAASLGTSAIICIAPTWLIWRRFKERALDSFLGGFFLGGGGGELLPLWSATWETAQRCLFENGKEWVMEAGFIGSLGVGVSALALNGITFLFKAL